MKRIAKHVGLKVNTTGWKGFPKENESKRKQHYFEFTPFCSTIILLTRFYKPYNDMLITLLRRTSSLAPPTEPFFKDIDPTETSPCVKEKDIELE